MVQKRVYIGGLYQGVREGDLRQRFSSYGSISGVEIKVKKDSEGAPLKTFAYLDIDATDTDLQKCFRAYNKTRWKGSELKLQFAKDSFMKMLEDERQEEQQTTSDQSPSKQRSSLEGVVAGSPGDRNLKITGATPGTPVPGQKDWVVGKYGRILPVVNVRSNDKKKLIKVDPSKYTHNVRKFKDDQTQDSGGISSEELTWKLEDNDSELTKRRKGEFPNWKSNKQKFESDSLFPDFGSDKPNTEADSRFPNFDNDMEIVPISDTVMHSSNKRHSLDSAKTNVNSLKRKSSNKGKNDFPSIDGASPSPSKANKISKKPKISKSVTKGRNSDDGYDTGDTDEIIAVSKKIKRESDSKKAVIQNEPRLQINPLQERLVALAQTEAAQRSSKLSKVASPARGQNENSLINNQFRGSKQNVSREKTLTIEEIPLMEFRGTRYLDDDLSTSEGKGSKDTATAVNDISTAVRADSDSSDSDFDSLIKKTMRKRQHSKQEPPKSKKTSKVLVSKRNDDGDNSENDSAGSADTDDILSSSKSPGKSKSSKAVSRVKPTFRSSSKNFDEFSSGLVTEHERENNVSKSEIYHETSDEESDFETLVKRETSKHETKSKLQQNETKGKPEFVKAPSDMKQSLKGHKSSSPTLNIFNKDSFARNSDSGSPVKVVQSKNSNKNHKIGKDLSDISRANVSEKTSSQDTSVDIDKKRQETVRQRQKEYQAQKNVIQKALANLDAGARTNKKIVFADSDEDKSDNEETIFTEKPTEGEVVGSQRMVYKKTSGSGLFEESSGESQDDEEDQDRFKLRPEFEGSAGTKLMKLQSRYGNDERFKLDAKFAESDSEQEENAVEDEDEKTRQLKILASVLGTSAGIVTDVHDKKKKTFKDVSKLHFDPTKADHSQFEITTVAKPKPVKVEKKKKKKSATAAEEDPSAKPDLPEVSKERFSEVSESIKQAFIKKDSSEPQGFSLLAAFGRKDQDSEDESDEDMTGKPFTSVLDPLTLESRFKVRESDSEHERDEEEDLDEDEETSEQPKSIFEDSAPVYVQPSTFFFTEDDPRLKEGEKFHRTEDMETIRERWFKQRPALVESYRSKHKKFKRMMKTKQQSKNIHSKQLKNIHSRKHKSR